MGVRARDESRESGEKRERVEVDQSRVRAEREGSESQVEG